MDYITTTEIMSFQRRIDMLRMLHALPFSIIREFKSMIVDYLHGEDYECAEKDLQMLITRIDRDNPGVKLLAIDLQEWQSRAVQIEDAAAKTMWDTSYAWKTNKQIAQEALEISQRAADALLAQPYWKAAEIYSLRSGHTRTEQIDGHRWVTTFWDDEIDAPEGAPIETQFDPRLHVKSALTVARLI